MKGPLNPELKKGDKIILYHMEGETSIPPGTHGTVVSIGKDPFELGDENLIRVVWDNGSQLSLVTSTDAWKKIPTENIQEQDKSWEFMSKNPEIFENFDWRFLREFLYKIRNSGITNMFLSSPLLYSGRENIDRYYGEGMEDDENFQAVLDDADTAKDKIIQGVIEYMKKNNKNLDDMDLVNKYARDFAEKITRLYVALSNYRHEN